MECVFTCLLNFIVGAWVFLPVCNLCITCEPSAKGNERRVSDILDLGLQVIVSCHVGAEYQAQALRKSSPCSSYPWSRLSTSSFCFLCTCLSIDFSILNFKLHQSASYLLINLYVYVCSRVSAFKCHGIYVKVRRQLVEFCSSTLGILGESNSGC